MDYINIYSNQNGKICGKDNYGNNLYFPLDIDCPLNKIYFSNKDEYVSDYVKLKFKNGIYLYYTNQSIEDKIIIDFRISSNQEIPLNPEYPDFLTNIPFYEEIDSICNEEKLFLFSINYLGINTSSIDGDNISKIEKLKHNIDVYKSLSKGKLALFCLMNVFIIIIIVIIIILDINNEIVAVISGITLGITCLLDEIFVIICLNIHLKYITNFMNKINLDYGRDKNDFKWNLVVLLFFISLGGVPFVVLIIKDLIHYQYTDPNEEIKRLEKIIDDKNAQIKQLKKNPQDSRTDNNTEILIINKKETEIERLRSENAQVNVYITRKDNKINNLNRTIRVKIEKIRNLNIKLNEKDDENINLNNTLDSQKEEIRNLNNRLNLKNEEIINLNNRLNSRNEETLGIIREKENRIKTFENEVRYLRASIPFEINENEHLMSIVIITYELENYPFICKKSQKFHIIEDALYEKKPILRETSNYFLCNSIRIIVSNTLEQNNINDGAVILMYKIEESENA